MSLVLERFREYLQLPTACAVGSNLNAAFAAAFPRALREVQCTHPTMYPLVESHLDLLRLFWIRFADRRVRIFFWIWRLFNRRRHGLGGRAKTLTGGQECFHFQGDGHDIQMPKFCEWKLSESTVTACLLIFFPIILCGSQSRDHR